jgi:hypothetical protein
MTGTAVRDRQSLLAASLKAPERGAQSGRLGDAKDSQRKLDDDVDENSQVSDERGCGR